MAGKGLDKEMVILAAAELVAEKGYQNFSLHEVASKLGVKTASLYKHIDNLKDVQSQVGIYAFTKLQERLMEGQSNKNDAQEAMMLMALNYRKFAKENPQLYKTIIHMPDANSAELIEEGKNILSGLQAMMEKINIAQVDIIHFERGLRSCMHGFITLEEAGFFANEVSVEESYKYMIANYIKSAGENLK